MVQTCDEDFIPLCLKIIISTLMFLTKTMLNYNGTFCRFFVLAKLLNKLSQNEIKFLFANCFCF